MSVDAAVRAAIDLLHVPSRVPYSRSAPLPESMLTVMRIAAGDEEAEIAAAESVGRPRDLVRTASVFFIEQILLSSDSDSYRVLGASRDATASELRRNMALMLRWLHPDMHHDHSVFASRVTGAWETLKTPQRRAAYDLQHPPRPESPLRRNRLPMLAPSSAGKARRRNPRRGMLRALFTLFSGARS